jgi:hypothetical protein
VCGSKREEERGMPEFYTAKGRGKGNWKGERAGAAVGGFALDGWRPSRRVGPSNGWEIEEGEGRGD